MLTLVRAAGALAGLVVAAALAVAGLVRPSWSRLLGTAFALALAHVPANDCPKLTRRLSRNFRVTQPNRSHRRAQGRGMLAIVR